MVSNPLISPENLWPRQGGAAARREHGAIGQMSKTTRATQALEKLGVKFRLHSYTYDSDADSIGLQAAEALGVEPFRMLKTLMAEVDGISPFGQKKRVPVAIEMAALGHATVFLNGGQRGLQIELDPNDAASAAGAIVQALTA